MAKTSKKTTLPKINDERGMRLRKRAELNDQSIDTYPARSQRSHTIEQALAAGKKEAVRIAGRVMLKRIMGKIGFAQIKDESGLIQIVVQHGKTDADVIDFFAHFIDHGDIIEVHGSRFQTNKGEESVLATHIVMLAKSVRPLPDKVKGLQDEETKFRKRYLDLLTNPELIQVFHRKSLFWASIRNFLCEKGFLEVETPVLETSSGGADARPFVTHHNALDVDVYLRISMGELWQKRLMIAGFEKTFEIGRQFRNEGLSREHLQDYTQMEFYWAYSNYEDGMQLVEEMYKHVIASVYGTLSFGRIGEFQQVDLSGAWERIDYTQTIQDQLNIDIGSASDAQLRKALDGIDAQFDSRAGRGRLIDGLWKHCRKSVKGPVFLVNLPVEVSPLAKKQVDNPHLVERYQVIIAGTELGNGYSELNDPQDQATRFEQQAALREAGDEEAQMYDKDFVEALEYGMPPATGFGVSERLFSVLENRPIRECVLFPLVRPKGGAS
jgi:lysyl-tRNA synthetase, class II